MGVIFDTAGGSLLDTAGDRIFDTEEGDMTATTFPELVTNNNKNVRKALKGGILIGGESVALPASLTAMSSGGSPAPALQALPGMSSFGFISDDGAVLAKDVNSSAINAWGEADPVRKDITSRTTTVKVTALETNKTVLATYHSIDPDLLVPDEDTGELIVTDTGDLETIYYRVLILAQDGSAGKETWIATLLPRASVTDFGSITFMSGDTAVVYDQTFTAYKDTDAGFSVKTFYCGPAWLAGLTAAGFGS